jgi:hypothetical protein
VGLRGRQAPGTKHSDLTEDRAGGSDEDGTEQGRRRSAETGQVARRDDVRGDAGSDGRARRPS